MRTFNFVTTIIAGVSLASHFSSFLHIDPILELDDSSLVQKSDLGLAQRSLDKGLLEAVDVGNVERIYKYLKLGANPNIKDKYGDPILHSGVIYGRPFIFALLAYGADPNARDSSGQTLLYCQVKVTFAPVIGGGIPSWPQTEVICQLLVLAGADWKRTDKAGTKLWDLAYELSDVRKVKKLFTDLDKNVPPTDAREELVKRSLVPKGSHSLTQISVDKGLIEAVELGNVERAYKYLKLGANPNTRDKYGDPMLHRGLVYQRQLLFALLAYGADPNSYGRFGQTPLYRQLTATFATMGGYFPSWSNTEITCELLVLAGADWKHVDKAATKVWDLVYESSDKQKVKNFFTDLDKTVPPNEGAGHTLRSQDP